MGNPGGSPGNGTSDENKGSIPDDFEDDTRDPDGPSGPDGPGTGGFQYGTCVACTMRFALRLLPTRRVYRRL